jgi:hypothetical protein
MMPRECRGYRTRFLRKSVAEVVSTDCFEMQLGRNSCVITQEFFAKPAQLVSSLSDSVTRSIESSRMKVNDEKEETSFTHHRFVMSMVDNLEHLQTILCQPLLSPQLDGMACWYSLASGNLAEAQSRCQTLADLEAMSSVM